MLLNATDGCFLPDPKVKVSKAMRAYLERAQAHSKLSQFWVFLCKPLFYRYVHEAAISRVRDWSEAPSQYDGRGP